MTDPSKDRPLVEALFWDDWNTGHIQTHSVPVAEVEEVLKGDPIYRTTYKNRFLVTGPSTSSRMLTVVIGEDPHQTGVYYVFSARSASREERKEFRTAKGG